MFHNTFWCTTDMYFCIYAFIQYLLRETTEITLVQNLRRKFREMLQLNTIRSILKVEVAKENHCNNNLSALRICIIINLLRIRIRCSFKCSQQRRFFIYSRRCTLFIIRSSPRIPFAIRNSAGCFFGRLLLHTTSNV